MRHQVHPHGEHLRKAPMITVRFLAVTQLNSVRETCERYRVTAQLLRTLQDDRSQSR
jgi:hypothetical protein